MRQIIWSILIGISLLSAGYVYANVLEASHWHPWMTSGMIIASTAGVMLFSYMFLKVYCATWEQLSKNGLYLGLYEHLVIPAMVLILPLLTIFHTAKLTDSDISKIQGLDRLLIFVTFMILMDVYCFLRRVLIDNWTNLNEPFAQGITGGVFSANLFVQYPPKNRSDMWPIDAIINGGWIALLVIHFV